MVWLWSDYMGFAWQIVCGVSVCTLMSKNDIFYPSHFWEPAVQSGGRKNASYVVLPQYRGTAGTTTSALHPLIVPQDTHTHSALAVFGISTTPQARGDGQRKTGDWAGQMWAVSFKREAFIGYGGVYMDISHISCHACPPARWNRRTKRVV